MPRAAQKRPYRLAASLGTRSGMVFFTPAVATDL